MDATASWTVGGTTVNVPGIFTYNPAAGTVLSAGNNQTLSVSFTPTDTSDYTNASATATINVIQQASTHHHPGRLDTRGRTGPNHHLHRYRRRWTTIALSAHRLGAVPDQRRERRLARAPDRQRHSRLFNDRAGLRFLHRYRGLLRRCELHRQHVAGLHRERPESGRVRRRQHTLRRRPNSSDYALISPYGSKPDGSTGLAVVATLNNAYTAKAFSQTFTAIDVFGYGGNDNFQLSSTLTLPTTVVEGNGNNYLLLAGGNDSVTLGSGSNQVFGGNGNKTITASDAAGTSGYISLGNGNENIQLGQGNDQVVLGSGNNTVTAGNGNDTVTATGTGNNTISLGNGNDSISTGNGTDVISLGSGNENIQVGNGQKTIMAGGGNDYVHAGSGNVSVTLLGGTDNVQLGGGNDNVSLGDGNDYVAAGDGNDNVTVGNGTDNVQLGNGSDVIVEGNGNDYVSAGNGPDLVVGGLGQHTIQLGSRQ